MQNPLDKFYHQIEHLAKYAEEHALGPIQRDEATLLFGVTRTIRPKVVVEFGFSYGQSALNFLQALDGQGDLYSYDISGSSARHAATAFSAFKNFHFIHKPQEQFSPADIDGRKIDLVFMDGAHDKEICQETFKAILPSLAANAIIAVHDTGTWKRKFFLPAHEDFQAKKPECWLNGEDFQHQRDEREFLNWITQNYSGFQLLHFHSENCLRHGITLLQNRRFLPTELQ